MAGRDLWKMRDGLRHTRTLACVERAVCDTPYFVLWFPEVNTHRPMTQALVR